MQQKISVQTVLDIAKKSRKEPKMILGNCDYVCREFVKNITNSKAISDEHIKLCIVNVEDTEGNKYTGGHMVVYLSPEIVGGNGITVDPTLDQFNNDHYDVQLEKTNINNIDDFQVFDGKPQSNQIYEFRRKAPLK